MLDKSTSIKVSVILVVFMYAFLSFSAVVHNLFDPNSNLGFVVYVLHGANNYLSLHVNNIIIVKMLFYVVVMVELIALIFLTIALVKFVRYFRDEVSFQKAKSFAIYGLLMCLVKYGIIFMLILGEWFYMWKTSSLTLTRSEILSGLIVIGLIYLTVTD